MARTADFGPDSVVTSISSKSSRRPSFLALEISSDVIALPDGLESLNRGLRTCRTFHIASLLVYS